MLFLSLVQVSYQMLHLCWARLNIYIDNDLWWNALSYMGKDIYARSIPRSFWSSSVRHAFPPLLHLPIHVLNPSISRIKLRVSASDRVIYWWVSSVSVQSVLWLGSGARDREVRFCWGVSPTTGVFRTFLAFSLSTAFLGHNATCVLNSWIQGHVTAIAKQLPQLLRDLYWFSSQVRYC